jgi:hypothetical protein
VEAWNARKQPFPFRTCLAAVKGRRSKIASDAPRAYRGCSSSVCAQSIETRRARGLSVILPSRGVLIEGRRKEDNLLILGGQSAHFEKSIRGSNFSAGLIACRRTSIFRIISLSRTKIVEIRVRRSRFRRSIRSEEPVVPLFSHFGPILFNFLIKNI